MFVSFLKSLKPFHFFLSVSTRSPEPFPENYMLQLIELPYTKEQPLDTYSNLPYLIKYSTNESVRELFQSK